MLFSSSHCPFPQEVSGYRVNIRKRCTTWFFIVLTCGILRLLLHWRSDWFLFWTHDRCALCRADAILVRDPYKQYFVVPIRQSNRRSRPLRSARAVLSEVRAFLCNRRVEPGKQRVRPHERQRDDAAKQSTIVDEDANVAKPPPEADDIVRVVTIRCDANANSDADAPRDTVCVQLESARQNAPLLDSQRAARTHRASHRTGDSPEEDEEQDDDRAIRFFVDRNVKYVTPSFSSDFPAFSCPSLSVCFHSLQLSAIVTDCFIRFSVHFK